MSRKILIKSRPDFFHSVGAKNLLVKEIVYEELYKKLKISCQLKDPTFLGETDIVTTDLQKKFGESLSVEFNIEYENLQITQKILTEIIEKAIEKLKLRNAVSKSFLFLYRVRVEEKNIYIELKNDMAIATLYESKINLKLETLLSEFGINDFKISFVPGDFSKEISEIEKEKENKIITLSQKLDSENEKNSQAPKEENNNQNNEKKFNAVAFRKTKEIKGKSISIDEFSEIFDNDICVIEGEVFNFEKKELKTGNLLYVMRITDNKNSVTTKMFVKPDENLEVKVGDFIKVSGRKQIDTFNENEEILLVSSLNKMEKTKTSKEDTSEEKMVELHTHSKMSEMVGVTEIGDLIKRAKSYGHTSMAITDYSVVHTFPFAFKQTKKDENFKVILGCEMYMVDDTKQMINNPKDIPIENENFVVFDLETTGLNSHEHEIIEIGAIKMEGTRIVDKFSKFVKPKRAVPEKIKNLTNITEGMLESAEPIEVVLPEFMEFVGNSTMVAHNAKFDMSFIRRDCKKILNIDYDPSVIDTLQMARDIFPDLKGYGLGHLTKKLGVALESHHRAVDDSQATAGMFKIFLEKYYEKGVKKVSEINGTFPINIQKQDTINIIVLAKNLVGLKNIYKLVSFAHKDNFGNKKPRVKKSEILAHRDGIFVGACNTVHFMNNGELAINYLDYNFKEMEKAVDFYDYVELLPKENYNEFIEEDGTNRIMSYKAIEEMNKYLYDLAKRHNKLVTGSSNVHYLEREEKDIRSILLYGSGNVFNERQYTIDNGFYFRTTDELLKEFSYLGEDIAHEIVITNTNKISNEIEKVQPIPDGFYPPELDNAENIVREMTYEKAHRIYGDPLPEIVSARLERELKAIIGHGFSVLYLSAQKLVKKSLDNGYLVGSRGSVGSSLVAFMMGITEVNALYPHYICTDPNCKYSEFIEKEGAGVDLPEKNCPKCGKPLKRDGHSIPFEVFMGFDGDKVPDIDLNFSGEYQSEIHRYCEELFGKSNVFKAGTISTLADKNAIGYVKKYYEDHHLNISKAEIIRKASKVEGAKKTTGQHPGGMVIVPKYKEVFDFCPIQHPANDMQNDSITTHFDYHVMDEQLVKLDILGHDDPTTIKMLQEYTGVNVYDIPIADPETLKIFSGTEVLGVTPEEIGSVVGTYGVPEFGTGFVRQMLEDTLPKTFAELVRISGLSHGTDVWLNNAQEFIREGTATLSEVITVRDDIMNYLIDSGMEKVTAFKIMEFVRKGKPSKEPENWEKFSNMMKEKNVKEWYIESCKRIKYMFPKGHAVAYVMMAMRIAYFKIHYPLAFYAAYLTRKMEDFDFEMMGSKELAKAKLEELNKEPKLDVKKKTQMAICEIVLEMYARGFEFLGIDLYKSEGFRFTIEDGKIRVPLMGISGLGASVVENIIAERNIEKFISYEDLKRRTKMSTTVLDKLKTLNAVKNLSDTNQISLF
ncbi:PolC-type DNA polymerase III [Fusobacterium perfoetens]|uniref:PolC-type DNA polymerase III n=1 Tax=Fusobacterium perfoetens TaxID=852 RepID=UPI00048798F3|nr:PolC-type DNA polymerase III [Fusobacterium perfoetens]